VVRGREVGARGAGELGCEVRGVGAGWGAERGVCVVGELSEAGPGTPVALLWPR
jgi:hypothetical protein